MMDDVDTQDILGVSQNESDDRLFFLLVATPKKPPKSLHKNVIQPFLNERGWQKVSYRSTGFRALYFLHDQQSMNESESMLATASAQHFRCARCAIFKEEEYLSRPKKKKLNESLKSTDETTSTTARFGCSSCDIWTPLQRASFDRDGLKKLIKKYKDQLEGTFQVHVILSKPVDQTEEFLEIASQPHALE